MFLKNLCIFTGICFCSLFSLAHSNQECSENGHLLGEILRNRDFAVKAIEGDRVYIKPEMLALTDKGIFLLGENGSDILLPFLFSDSSGCYLKISSKASGDEIPDYVVIKCSNCKRNYVPSPFNKGKCPYCGESN